MRLHLASDEHAWIATVTEALSDALTADLRTHSRVRLLLSGGSTPGPIYCALAAREPDWSRIDVGLVDDRWVAPDSRGSNARLIRETMLDANHSIHFEPLPTSGASTEVDASLASEVFARGMNTATTAVFGMGSDGHVASLIPGSEGFAEAMQSTNAYVAIHAPHSPVAAPWPDRISLGNAGIAQVHRRLLLIRGNEKRALLERATQGDDIAALPVRILLTGSVPLDVYWCE